MSTLGIYIYNSTRDQWFSRISPKYGPVWGGFKNAFEWSDDGDEAAEETRLKVSGDDVTFTMAALH